METCSKHDEVVQRLNEIPALSRRMDDVARMVEEMLRILRTDDASGRIGLAEQFRILSAEVKELRETKAQIGSVVWNVIRVCVPYVLAAIGVGAAVVMHGRGRIP